MMSDPTWIFERYDSVSEVDSIFFQVDLLGDLNDSWNFMKNECPKYPEELQLGDLIDLCKSRKVFVSLDFNINNIEEILGCFSSKHGIAFTLGSKSSLNNNHYFEFDEVVRIIQIVNNSPS